nr:glycine cleavage system protein GcvH [Candidatus Sigynarchaeota archaeon]
MSVPDDLLYTKTHEWAKVGTNGTFLMGITDHAQHELTDIVYVDDFPELGDDVKAGAVVSVIESVKAVADVFSPLSGKVLEINQELENKPESLNKAPYDSWILKIKMSDEKELDQLLKPDQYKAIL